MTYERKPALVPKSFSLPLAHPVDEEGNISSDQLGDNSEAIVPLRYNEYVAWTFKCKNGKNQQVEPLCLSTTTVHV